MRSLLVDRRVVVAVVVQTVGYAALLAVVPHSDPSGVVDAVAAVPVPLLVVVALPAVPAAVLTVLLGAVLSSVGLPPASLPALLLARGDVLFFAVAYGVAAAATWANRRAETLAADLA